MGANEDIPQAKKMASCSQIFLGSHDTAVILCYFIGLYTCWAAVVLLGRYAAAFLFRHPMLRPDAKIGRGHCQQYERFITIAVYSGPLLEGVHNAGSVT